MRGYCRYNPDLLPVSPTLPAVDIAGARRATIESVLFDERYESSISDAHVSRLN